MPRIKIIHYTLYRYGIATFSVETNNKTTAVEINNKTTATPSSPLKLKNNKRLDPRKYLSDPNDIIIYLNDKPYGDIQDNAKQCIGKLQDQKFFAFDSKTSLLKCLSIIKNQISKEINVKTSLSNKLHLEYRVYLYLCLLKDLKTINAANQK